MITTGNLSGNRPLRKHWDKTNGRERVPFDGAELTAGDWSSGSD